MSIIIYAPSANELAGRLAVRTVLQPLAPFPAPRLHGAPWDLTRAPYDFPAPRHAKPPPRQADTTPPAPTAPGVAHVSISRPLTVPSLTTEYDARSAIIPAPAHLTGLTARWRFTTFTQGAIWLRIPGIGYYDARGFQITASPVDNIHIPIDLDILQPTTLQVGYDVTNTTGASQTGGIEIYANLGYRPLAS